MNKVIKYVFGSRGGGYVIDNYDMSTIAVIFDFKPNESIRFVMDKYSIFPRSAGVGLKYEFRNTNRKIFAFGDERNNFRKGNFKQKKGNHMTRIASPFAASGDKEQIPQTKQDTGEISFSEGYGPDYEKDLDNDTGAKTIERAKLNWLLCLVTSEIKKYQEQGIPDCISKEDNGGIDYPYAAAAMVRYNNKIYYSLKDANTDKPDTNSWSLLDPSEYLSVGGGTINGDLTITGSLDINGEQPYTKSNPPPATPNSLSIGTVTTLEPGAPATAVITGEAPEQTLSLGIPAGAPGEDGADGAGGGNIKISAGGTTYKPDADGVITLGSAAGRDIEENNRDVSWAKKTVPEWVPAGPGMALRREIRGPRLLTGRILILSRVAHTPLVKNQITTR